MLLQYFLLKWPNRMKHSFEERIETIVKRSVLKLMRLIRLLQIF